MCLESFSTETFHSQIGVFTAPFIDVLKSGFAYGSCSKRVIDWKEINSGNLFYGHSDVFYNILQSCVVDGPPGMWVRGLLTSNKGNDTISVD